MRNYLLPTLVWAVFSMPVVAQRTLSAGLQPYAANWTYTVVHSLQRAGFEMPARFVPAGSPVVRDRSGVLQLDSTKTFYNYDAVTGDSVPVFRALYQYPAPDIRIETNFQYENDGWRQLNRTTYYSDAQHRVTKALAEVFDPVTQVAHPDSRVLVVPHGDSPTLIDTLLVEQWDTAQLGWLLLFATTYTYDASDRTMDSRSTFNYFGAPLLLLDTYFYDADGDNTLIETFALQDGLDIPLSRRELEYKDHLPTRIVTSGADENGVFQPQELVITVYTGFGKQELVEDYAWDFDTGGWLQTKADTYAYDAAHRVILHESALVDQAGTIEKERTTYAYVEGENLALETFYNWDGNDFYLGDRTYYYYSDGTSGVADQDRPVRSLIAAPNPTDGPLRLNLPERAVVRVYTAQGALVLIADYQPGEIFSLSQFPAGLYLLTARSGNFLYGGRLVKE